MSQLAPTVRVASACDVLGVARASFYRTRPQLGPELADLPVAPAAVRPTPARALSPDERQLVRCVLNSARFQDCSPAAIQATLLDEGQYLCALREFGCERFVFEASLNLHQLGLKVNVAKVKYCSKKDFQRFWGFVIMDYLESENAVEALLTVSEGCRR